MSGVRVAPACPGSSPWAAQMSRAALRWAGVCGHVLGGQHVYTYVTRCPIMSRYVGISVQMCMIVGMWDSPSASIRIHPCTHTPQPYPYARACSIYPLREGAHLSGGRAHPCRCPFCPGLSRFTGANGKDRGGQTGHLGRNYPSFCTNHRTKPPICHEMSDSYTSAPATQPELRVSHPDTDNPDILPLLRPLLSGRKGKYSFGQGI